MKRKSYFQDKAQDSYKYEMKKKYPSELVQETAIEVQMPKNKKIIPLTVLEEEKYLRLTFDMKKIATPSSLPYIFKEHEAVEKVTDF